MACTECIFGFFYNPTNVLIAGTSLILSVMFYLFMKEESTPRKKIFLIYAHLFTLIFPVVFYIYTNSCVATFGLGFCNAWKPLLSIFFMTGLSSIVLGYLLTPLLLKVSPKTSKVVDHEWNSFLGRHAKKEQIREPSLHLFDTAKPMAFCISILKPRIYLSVGLAELLTKKEVEAVLLHELGHVKQQSNWLKFSTYLHKLASPFTTFTDFTSMFVKEENNADSFAIKKQRTKKYLLSAKKKLNEYQQLL